MKFEPKLCWKITAILLVLFFVIVLIPTFDTAVGATNFFVSQSFFDLGGNGWQCTDVFDQFGNCEYEFNPNHYGVILTALAVICSFSVGLFLTKQKTGFFLTMAIALFTGFLGIFFILDPILAGNPPLQVLEFPILAAIQIGLLLVSGVFIYCAWKSKAVF